jgi:hypothetical protein
MEEYLFVSFGYFLLTGIKIVLHTYPSIKGFKIYLHSSSQGGEQWHSWLRHCAIRMDVPGSISGGVLGSFK